MAALEVLFTPAEFAALKQRDLGETVCVVFDVLRATSTMAVALGNGAAAIVPVEEIAEAVAFRRQQPDVLLAGEREGVRIQAGLTGGTAFDLGNSPREFTRERVRGRTIVITTTNGTRALRACARARTALACSFLNLRATADFIQRELPASLLVVCGGTHEEAAYEDVLAAGALCELLWPGAGMVADSAYLARRLFQVERADLPGAVALSRNGRRLPAMPELREDVSFCLQRDTVNLVARLSQDGRVKKAD